MARIHVRGWQHAYRGHLPASVLDSLSIERREEGWRGRLSGGPDHGAFVAEREGRVVGFAQVGPPMDAGEVEGTGQLYTIYVDPDQIGTGVGRALMGRAVAELRRRGFGSAYLWVLGSNDRARRFYERAGWRADGGAKVETMEGAELHEVRYRVDLDRPGAATRPPPAS